MQSLIAIGDFEVNKMLITRFRPRQTYSANKPFNKLINLPKHYTKDHFSYLTR